MRFSLIVLFFLLTFISCHIDDSLDSPTKLNSTLSSLVQDSLDDCVESCSKPYFDRLMQPLLTANDSAWKVIYQDFKASNKGQITLENLTPLLEKNGYKIQVDKIDSINWTIATKRAFNKRYIVIWRAQDQPSLESRLKIWYKGNTYEVFAGQSTL